MKNQDVIIDALTDKVAALKKESDGYRDELGFYFDFIQDQPQSQRLEFVKHVYLNAFDENYHGRSADVFRTACRAIKVIMECAEDKEFFTQVNDYLFRLEECVKQFEQVGELYNTDHLFGYELTHDFGYGGNDDE